MGNLSRDFVFIVLCSLPSQPATVTVRARWTWAVTSSAHACVNRACWASSVTRVERINTTSRPAASVGSVGTRSELND